MVDDSEKNIILSDIGLQNDSNYEFDVDNYPLASEPTQIDSNLEGIQILVERKIRDVEIPRTKIRLDSTGWSIAVSWSY